MATKKIKAKEAKSKARPLSERWKPSAPGTQRRKVHDLYESGMSLKDIAKKLKLKYGNVSGHVSNYREGHKLNGTDKVFNGKGKLVSKASVEKETVAPVKKKKPVAKKKKVVKKPKVVKTPSKKKVKEAKPTKTNNKIEPKKEKINKPGPGTKVYEAPEDDFLEEEEEESEVDEFTGKPLF